MLGTGDVSVDYKPVPWMTSYLTFDFNQSTVGNKDGGFDSFSKGGQSVDYHYQNFLYEGGAKFDLLNHTLFATVDGYYQMHDVTNVTGTTTEVRSLGAEMSATYQPDKHFYVQLNASYLNATLIDPGSEFTANVYDAFSTTSVGVDGTGGGIAQFQDPA